MKDRPLYHDWLSSFHLNRFKHLNRKESWVWKTFATFYNSARQLFLYYKISFIYLMYCSSTLFVCTSFVILHIQIALNIYFKQIWFGKCNFKSFKVKNFCCVWREFLEILDLICLSIHFFIPNLSQSYLSLPEIFKTNVSNRFLNTKFSVEFVFSCCEFTNVIL